MKMSALGEAFSVVMRVCSSPAAASGKISTSTPGLAFLNASTNALFVDSFSAEYTLRRPVALAAAAGAVVAPAAGGLAAAVGAALGVALGAQAAATSASMDSAAKTFGTRIIPIPLLCGSACFDKVE